MVFLKLLGYAVGSVVMYWGIILLLLGPLFLVVILTLLANQAWNKITGREEEWRWFVNGFESVMQFIDRLNFQWIGWIPGILIQVWYAGYAVHLVQSSTLESSSTIAIAIHSMGVVGMVVAAATFYWLYAQVVAVKLGRWIYLLVGGVALGAYFVLLQQPQTAAVLSDSWQRVFSALLTEAIGSL